MDDTLIDRYGQYLAYCEQRDRDVESMCERHQLEAKTLLRSVTFDRQSFQRFWEAISQQPQRQARWLVRLDDGYEADKRRTVAAFNSILAAAESPPAGGDVLRAA